MALTRTGTRTANPLTGNLTMLAPAVLLEVAGSSLPSISASSWLSILYLGALSSAVATLLYNRSLQNLSASQTANFLNLMPVVAVLIAVVFLEESPIFSQIAGGGLVLAGVWISLQNKCGATKIAETSTG